MNLPPLKALPVFEAVARLNSFSRAAAELHVSQSAISHQIRQLENHLGESLFLRAGRKLSLTEQGCRYLESIGPALQQIRRASEALQGREDTELRVALFGSFAVRWLIPRLPDLQRRHPGVRLRLEMIDGQPELSDRLADCFITLRPMERGYSSVLLYAERLFPICSRRFWERICEERQEAGMTDPRDDGEQLQPDWLLRYPLLSATSILGEPGEDWRRWLTASGVRLDASSRIQHFSHMLLAHEATRHHQGIALTNDYMLGADEDPDLVRLPCRIMYTGDEFHFVYKTSRRREPGIRVLRAWLLEQAIGSGLRASEQERGALP